MTVPRLSNTVRWLVIGVVVLAAWGVAWATSPDASTNSDDRAYRIGSQLRCLQCNGESVAGSDVQLARTMRAEIRDQIAAGKTDDEIYSFFVATYKEKVLLNPSSSGLGAAVWILPPIVAAAAVMGLVLTTRESRRTAAKASGTAPASAAAATGPPAETVDPESVGPATAQPETVDSETAKPGSVQPEAAHQEPAQAAPTRTAPTQIEPAPTAPTQPDSRRRILGLTGAGLATVAVVLLAAGGVGLLMAKSLGSRLPGDSTTATSGSRRSMLDSCQQLMGQQAKEVACYDRVLEKYPNDPEGLAYRGWAKVRSDGPTAGDADLNAAIKAEPTYADPHVFLAVAAMRQEDWDTASDEIQKTYELDPPQGLLDTMNQMGLEQKVDEGMLDPAIAKCWEQTKIGLGQADLPEGATAPDPVEVVKCYGNRITEMQADQTVDPTMLARSQTLMGWAVFNIDQRLSTVAMQQLQGAIATNPKDPSPLLARGFIHGTNGEWDEAMADAQAAKQLTERPSVLIAATTGDAEVLIKGIEEGKAASSTEAASSTTAQSATPTTPTVPGPAAPGPAAPSTTAG